MPKRTPTTLPNAPDPARESSSCEPQSSAQQLTAYIRSGKSGLYLVSYEEVRVEAELLAIAKELNFRLCIWSLTQGVITVTDTPPTAQPETEDPLAMLATLEKLPEKTLLLARDLHVMLSGDPNPVLVRKIKDVLLAGQTTNKVLIIVGCRLCLPEELTKEVAVVEFKLPDRRLLLEVAQGIAKSAGIELNGNCDSLLDAASGLTTTEASDAFSLSIIEAKELVPAIVAKQKAMTVKKNGILEIIETDARAEDIGGLEVLKTWLSRRRLAFGKEAKEYGLPVPKGVLAIGLPGSGKSLTAKAAASILGVPLLKMDCGKLFGGLVGQSIAPWEEITFVSPDSMDCVRMTIEQAFANQERLIGWLTPTYSDYLQPECGHVAAIFRHRLDGPLLKIRLRSGREISVTADHSLFALGPNGRLVEITGSQILVGNHIAVAGRTSIATPISSVSTGANASTRRHGNQAIIAPDRVQVTPQLCRFLGWFAAEGDTNGLKAVRLSVHENEVNEVAALLRDVMGKEPCTYRMSERHSGSVTVGSISWAAVLNNWQLGCGQKYRRAPDWMFGCSEECVAAFLKGLFSGEGSVTNRGVEMSSISQKLIEDTALLLTRFSIFARYGEHRSISGFETENTAYRLTITGPSNLQRFRDRIGFDQQAKTDSLRSLTQRLTPGRERSGGIDSVPYMGAVCSEINRLRRILYQTERADVRRDRKCTNVPSLLSLLASRGFTAADSWLFGLVNSGVAWDEVMSIQPIDGTEYVYDVSVPSVERFVTNAGVIAHNSEANMRSVIHTAEAVAPCVLFVDELEKAFSGSKSSGSTDGGTSARVFGTFLTWMNDKTAPVFVFATANSVADLPPEFLRKGRFDELFYCDLPDIDERVAIWTVHLKKRGRKPADFDLRELSQRTEGFTGAEIEAAVNEGLFSAFDEEHTDLRHELEDRHLLEAIRNTVPLSRTMAPQIDALRAWAVGRARRASADKTHTATVSTGKGRKLA